MSEIDKNDIVEREAITVETTVIAIISGIFFTVSTEWEYFYLFQLAIPGVLLTMLLRVMASQAEDPNMAVIQRSLRWSSKLLLIAILGAVAAVSIHISTIIGVITPVALFAGLATALSLSSVLLDELWLGEYTDTWTNVAYRETDENIFGQIIRSSIDYGSDQMDSILNNQPTPQNNLKGVALAIGLLSLFLFISSPIWLLLSRFFNGYGVAIIVLLSIVFLRDLSRYIQISYGAATSISELKWSLRWEFAWIILLGILTAEVLGYNITELII